MMGPPLSYHSIGENKIWGRPCFQSFEKETLVKKSIITGYTLIILLFCDKQMIIL